jgi:hypothetical protein
MLLLVSFQEAVASKGEVKAVNNKSNDKIVSLLVTPMELDRYKVKVTVEWKKIPKVRKWDVIAISFANNSDYNIIFSTTKATQTYKAGCTAGNEQKQETETIRYTYFDHQSHFNFSSNGIALKQNLKNDWVCEDNFFSNKYYKIVELTQTLEFIVEKDSDLNTNKFSAKAFYAHNKGEQSDFSIGAYHFFFGLGKFRLSKDTSNKLSLGDFGIGDNGELMLSETKSAYYDDIRTVNVQVSIAQ